VTRLLSTLKPRTFTRRSLLPLKRDCLWQIETGVVRTFTWLEDGNIVTLGLWGMGDIVGRVLSTADPYHIECLTPTEVTALPLDRSLNLTEATIKHIQQLQEFMEIIRCRSVDASLLRLLAWLANKFGNQIVQGKLIDLGLTHQEIAEILGTSRVTVTRFLNNFEQQGIIQRLPNKVIILKEEQAFWHYEI
jgi:CRP-like cAMP-binding protein